MKEMTKTSQLAVRRFFASEAGNQLIDALKASGPEVVKGQPHEIIFDAGKAQGFANAINMIEILANHVPVTESDLETPGLQ